MIHNGHTEKICNLDYLNGFANGNDQFVKEMINIFLLEIPGELQNFENAVNNGDYEAIRHSAHKLKSTISFVGITRLIINNLLAIEKLAGEQTGLDKIKEHFTHVKQICGKASEELHEGQESKA